MPSCVFRSELTSFNLKEKRKYTAWIKNVIDQHGCSAGDLVFVFCDDEFLLQYNSQFLNHHTFTDIITFDYSENKRISGDILISVERVKENALKLNISFENELQRVMIHGILHLLGYKDKTPAHKTKMTKAENQALTLWV
ncbi:MAG: rRNA maturation RNase YbeY [Bacteroidota bacterium]|jgi:probable rRNA maturation factor